MHAMKKIMKNRVVPIAVFAFLLSAFQFSAGQNAPATRPRIVGIDHVSFYTTAPDGVKKLYGDILGLASADPLEPGGTLRYLVGAQWVGYSPAPDPKATDRMDHVAFRTDNIVALRRYFTAKGIKASQIEGRADHSLSLMVIDPEGHRVEFVERGKGETPPALASAVSRHMIHTGFVVRDRDAENHFYLEILGFRPYWHGGMKDGDTDWVSLQVPDGSDWLEYMLNQPQQIDLERTGVMNHISLGVADMSKAQALLELHGWKPHGGEHAQMGRDGKRQLNVFDPDFSRIELMEFKPAEKPCCSDFTAPHPTE
jgi:catechol 2,3-dioxygenase-like lactoylglutathione lyase family enzyme